MRDDQIPAVLHEVELALHEQRLPKILGPRRPVRNATPAGTARFPLDPVGSWDTRRAKTFAGRAPREPLRSDFLCEEGRDVDADDEPEVDEEAYTAAHDAWVVEAARVKAWATCDESDVVYFDTEPEAAAFADERARAAGYVLLDEKE
jgi:hypothetical protein